ncbi:MAG: hypothetical protein Q7S40_07915 [Opitutaceae bacterium]|nr:hypothetical protein [Opitutaceae bacterium]
MSDTTSNAAVIAAAAAGLAAVSHAAGSTSVDDLIAKITTKDNAVRGPAWQGAAPYGAAAVKRLAGVMPDEDFETARSAKRALWVIVRHAGRPGAAKEATAVAKELVALLPTAPAATRREVLWMLSEIAGDDAIAAVAALLSDKDVRADAVATLMRLPGRKSTAAIKSAFASAPEDFKFALADALRKRGEKVAGYPSQKMVPTRSTTVTQPPAAAAN